MCARTPRLKKGINCNSTWSSPVRFCPVRVILFLSFFFNMVYLWGLAVFCFLERESWSLMAPFCLLAILDCALQLFPRFLAASRCSVAHIWWHSVLLALIFACVLSQRGTHVKKKEKKSKQCSLPLACVPSQRGIHITTKIQCRFSRPKSSACASYQRGDPSSNTNIVFSPP